MSILYWVFLVVILYYLGGVARIGGGEAVRERGCIFRCSSQARTTARIALCLSDRKTLSAIQRTIRAVVRLDAVQPEKYTPTPAPPPLLRFLRHHNAFQSTKRIVMKKQNSVDNWRMLRAGQRRSETDGMGGWWNDGMVKW